jgi:hypothetical protein
MTLELSRQASEKLEAYTAERGLTPSEAILGLLELAEIEAAFDDLEGIPERSDEEVGALALESVRAYRRQ